MDDRPFGTDNFREVIYDGAETQGQPVGLCSAFEPDAKIGIDSAIATPTAWMYSMEPSVSSTRSNAPAAKYPISLGAYTLSSHHIEKLESTTGWLCDELINYIITLSTSAMPQPHLVVLNSYFFQNVSNSQAHFGDESRAKHTFESFVSKTSSLGFFSDSAVSKIEYYYKTTG